MMAYSEDHIALAAEYALGTLDADERAQVETMMAIDKDFTAIVQAWEFRLGVLNQMVGSVEPRPIVWENIKSAIEHSEPQAPLVLPQAPPPVAPVVVEQAPVVDNSNVIRLSSRIRRWRSIATVAVLQAQGGSPAFILTVDGATKNLTVRRVGAAAVEPSKSYELWLISDKLPRPRSLGVIGGGDFTARPVLASYDSDVVNGATYAVTIEQPGGSPDGNPHSAPVYTGKLIETVPPGSPLR